jgi:hypothetical protein
MAQNDRQVCFRLACAVPTAPANEALQLADAPAEALAELLQVFACGEESAALAFAQFNVRLPESAVRLGLARIAGEEVIHESLLRQLRAGLPEPEPDRQLRKAVVRFYHGLARTDARSHFAAIAAVDSAVCQILAALLAPDRVLSREPNVATVFHRIHREEAGHVRLSRRLTTELVGTEDLRAVAENARLSLVAVLSRRAAAFESLGVDASRLFAAIGSVPNGLLR